MYTYENALKDYRQEKADILEAYRNGELAGVVGDADLDLNIEQAWRDIERYIDEPGYWERR